MRVNRDHLCRVPVMWFDGSFFYRRTCRETVSTLTQDLLGYCPAQARLKPVAGEAAGQEAMIGTGQTSEPQAPDVPWDAPRMGVDQFSLGGLRCTLSRCLQRPTPTRRT